MKKFLRTLSLFVLAFFLLQPSLPVSAAQERLAGKDRYQVAKNAALEYFSEADTVLLVNGQAWPDALSASNLSRGQEPILYSGKDQLPQASREALEKIQPQRIILVGGPSSLSDSLQTALRKVCPQASLYRIQGKDRYEVSRKSVLLSGKRDLLLSTGETYADALIAAPLVKQKEAALLILPPQGLDSESQAFFQDHADSALFIGGSLSTALQQEVDSILGKASDRISGADRYVVSAKVQETFFPESKTYFLASGQVFADALVAGPIAQQKEAPILLTRSDQWPESVKARLSDLEEKTLLVVGGESTLPDRLLAALSQSEEDPQPEQPAQPNPDPQEKPTEDIVVPDDHPTPPPEPQPEPEPEPEPVPVLRKFGIPHFHQVNGYFCGPASMQMIMQYLGATTSADGEELTQWACARYLKCTASSGSMTSDLAPALNAWLGKDVYRLIRQPSAETFRSAVIAALDSGYPLMINTNECRGGYHYNGHNNATYGHIIVLEGYDSEEDLVYFKDPGTSIWGRAASEFSYPLESFVARFITDEYTDLVGFAGTN